MKLMGKQDATSGCVTDIKLYAPSEYTDDLVDLSEWPEGTGPWVYDSETQTAVAASSSLSLSESSISVTPDNSDTVDVVISGTAGKGVSASFSGAVPIGAVQWTLDGSGEATVTFGPTMLRTVRPIVVSFDLDDGSSPTPVALEVNLQ
jgi:hypothetical protein